jgi:hypothetical protein
MSPHGTFSADYVALLRNMLVAEAPSGNIELLSGASPGWLAPGMHITVTGAPTARGAISFTERSSTSGETLTWSSSMPIGTLLSWRLPWWARHVRASTGRTLGTSVLLPVPSGTVRVRFDGRRPSQSYAASVAALNDSYLAHHLPPPLAIATG